MFFSNTNKKKQPLKIAYEDGKKMYRLNNDVSTSLEMWKNQKKIKFRKKRKEKLLHQNIGWGLKRSQADYVRVMLAE